MGLRFFYAQAALRGASPARHAIGRTAICAADAPKSQCYTARTVHVVYPQQAGRLQTGGLE
ncbi:MAG: hypothetical protein PPHEINF_0302 [uncultured Paraburkholderia sp.]|nr:MAG: hypothetical protein PPHEINF_0302 [uncultured Paraburkholderia sp.]CAH2775278.1 MAG: hypothetical protein PPHEESC_0298 [uncultured Paraburkholderia sp.]CAH2938922.1 MAG: hypothetical protein PPHERAN_4853 [uncultured Paraburkholderia sp.]